MAQAIGEMSGRADANGDVDAFIDDVDNPVGKCNLRRQFWVPVGKTQKQRHDLHAAEGDRDVDPQPADRLTVMRRKNGFGVLEFCENAYAGLSGCPLADAGVSFPKFVDSRKKRVLSGIK
jgi:hypothetical protein